MDSGVTPERFWELSIAEIIDSIETSERKELNDFKIRATEEFVLANAISSRIAYLFNDPKKRRKTDILEVWDVWPDLFNDEREATKKAEERKALAIHKQQMEAYAARWNAKRKKDAERT